MYKLLKLTRSPPEEVYETCYGGIENWILKIIKRDDYHIYYNAYCKETGDPRLDNPIIRSLNLFQIYLNSNMIKRIQ